MTRRTKADQAARAARLAAIRACRRCDRFGFRLGPDGLDADVGIRCDHNARTAPPAGRDITEPIYQRPTERAP